MGGKEIERTLPLLPLRGLLVFPTMVLHLDVGRERSIQALEQAMVGENLIVLSSQQEVHIEEPHEEDIYQIGIIAKVRQMLKLPNGNIRILVEGLVRARILSYLENDAYHLVRSREIEDKNPGGLDIDALKRSILDHFEQYLNLSNKLSSETYTAISDIEDPGRFADIIASHLPIKIAEKQEILECVDVKDRLGRLLSFLYNEKEVLELENKISLRVKMQMEKAQKEYYLREQMKAIQKELGEKEGRVAEVEELRHQLDLRDVPENVRIIVEKEIDRLGKMHINSAEGGVLRTYIDWILDLPWGREVDEVDLDIGTVEEILEEDHYGLIEAKERILEYLAVQQMAKNLKTPILCLVGPPGVGKTSLARSIARALHRKFVRISLGGVRDEAEIRGHRRTYVGAMPGRIIQGMKTANSVNPVFLLDEIDKMSANAHGDPAAALLEVLDPNQNDTFRDHYIEIPFDLSKVMFITTANTLHSISRPLLDRMEIVYLSGYTELEKEQIAKTYLIPKQINEHGLSGGYIQIKKDAVQKIIRSYTREAGVRRLEQVIGRLCRKAARKIIAQEKKRVVITTKNMELFLGPEKYMYGRVEEVNQIGVVTGLAWTEAGGDTLQVEVSLFPGTGKLVLTGKLGEVMKESAQAAFSFIRSRVKQLNIDPEFHEKQDIHIHVPEGAIPKDGPSAGITIATALVSALTQVPVSRFVAMTGEVTLRGRVLQIGGLKEKALSAHRAGIKHVVIPKDNERDLQDIPACVKKDIRFTVVRNMDEVLQVALVSDVYENN